MSFRLAMVLFWSTLRYCFTGGVQIPPEVSPPEVSPPEVSPPEVSPPGVTTPDPLSVSPLFPHADNKNTDPHTVKTIAIIIANSFFIVSPFIFYFLGIYRSLAIVFAPALVSTALEMTRRESVPQGFYKVIFPSFDTARHLPPRGKA